MEHNDIVQLLNRFLSELNITVTKSSIADELDKHPNSNTLLGISEVLSSWNVPNAAYSVVASELFDVPNPFLAFSTKHEFMMVHSLDKHTALISTGSREK